ncbi:dihydroorotate dehydrogenase (fumarate) [Plasmodium fragile]|uniref:Dihydroorotate dehydrogenase (quinone), mitochondrial n=1 Tax=Plasmodium fragile TaxID=5857 RepID=A0A0D9QPN7_PLAFR|nr:dihydroorotate dehydrogenase (fumarate) [Plasmodium fragile]KJP88898.1 dihydroorotate dehydrogenase (fumarate) [Plasmodium fragile]
MFGHSCLREKRYLMGGSLLGGIRGQVRVGGASSLGSCPRINKNDTKWYASFVEHVMGGGRCRPVRSEFVRRHNLMAPVRRMSGESNYAKGGRPPPGGGDQGKDDPDMKGSSKSEKKKQLEEEMKKLHEQIAKEKGHHKKVLVFIFTCVVGLYMYFESYDPEFFLYDIFLKILLKYVDGEMCHDLFLLMGKYNLLPYDTSKDSIYSCQSIKGLNFMNPIGVAAGFDKNGVCIDSILKLGFSFIEVGTVTPKPQKGNEKPRIFRDVETKSIINACGFNNIGCDEVSKNLKRFREKQRTDKLLQQHIVGVSLGKNKDSPDILEDLSYCIARVGRYADYIAINVSSPNTPGLRDNQQSERLQGIILRVKEEIGKLGGAQDVADEQPWVNTTKQRPLIFVKLAPDLDEGEKKKIANVLLKTEVDGMIICNTTTQKFNIKNFQDKKGGVSGAKLKDISTNMISQMYNYTNRRIPIIASGGIFSGRDVLEKIEAGASVCQLYSGLVFNGMKAAVRVKRELDHLLYQRGYYKLEDAIGKAHRRGA